MSDADIEDIANGLVKGCKFIRRWTPSKKTVIGIGTVYLGWVLVKQFL